MYYVGGDIFGTTPITFPIKFTKPTITISAGRSSSIFTSTTNIKNEQGSFANFLLDSVSESGCSIQLAGTKYIQIIGY